MGIGKTVADCNRKEFCEVAKGKALAETKSGLNSNSNTNSNRGRKNRRRHHKKAEVSPVQKLYNTCSQVFAFSGTGIVPSRDGIEKVLAVLDNIKPGDVGLDPEMPYFCSPIPGTGTTPPIRYLHLYDDEKFSMGIFCLPPSGVIPLHNHPGMTVFSKLLFGTMHIKSYDWEDGVPGHSSTYSEVQNAEKQTEIQQPGIRLARVKVDSDFTAPCNTSILYPADGGNMHRFTAVTACAVLDVLGPPYAEEEERPCTYYFDFPYSKFSVDGVAVPEEESGSYAWLQERETVEGVTVIGEMYRGPKIVAN